MTSGTIRGTVLGMPIDSERQRMILEAVGIKGQFANTAARMLRRTPAYAEARRNGNARAWLYDESQSFAESAYAILLDRVDEAGGDGRVEGS